VGPSGRHPRLREGEPAEVAMASEECPISRREFMEETYRDTSVSNSLDDAVGRLGFRV